MRASTETMTKGKYITTIEAAFDQNKKTNLGFEVGEGTASLHLITDGKQMADVAKLLLLKGKNKTFVVEFYESKCRKDIHAGQRKKIKIIR